jgi:MOSC domain-containing protein YiiM
VTSPRLLAVNAVHELVPDRKGDLDLTAIDKRPLTGRVRIHRLGVNGDQQYDTRNHGGPDQAVYAYAAEDARWWAAELGRDVPPGCFGENLTTEGLDVTAAVIGERWRIGSAVLQVRSPRIPCRTFAGFWDVPDLIKRFTAHGASGAYLSVVEEGEVGMGDSIDVVDRPAHGVTIGELFAARSGDRDVVPRMLDVPELPAEYADWARRVLGLEPA